MKKKLLLPLLCLLLLLTACGGAAPGKEASGALEAGLYALYDSDDALSGYLEVTALHLTRYDARGGELERLSYSYDAGSDRYTDETGERFTVAEGSRGLVLRRNGQRFSLDPIRTLPAPPTPEPTPAPTPEPTPEPTREPDAEDVYRIALASSVEVTAYLSEYYYSTGSGFFDDENGTVITNYHVIEDSYEAAVTTADGTEYAVTGVVAWDAELDIAVLATECAGSTPLEKRTDSVRPGEDVYAFGSPLGFTATFSDGIVSNARRRYEGMDYIQHTAPISHGNSGGPLLDGQGRVVGIVCAYFEGGQNLNLAIPIGEVETLSRGEPVQLEALFYTEEPASANEGWSTACIGDNLGWSLYADMPEELYDALEINETNTGLSSELTAERFSLALNSDILDLEGDEFDEQDAEELSAMLDEAMAELTETYQVTNSSVTINDEEWIAFTAYGVMEQAQMVNYLLLRPTPDGAAVMVLDLVVSAPDEGFDEGDDMAFDILSSLFSEYAEG